MSFAARNSLILGILLVLIVGGGGYWTSIRQPAKLRGLDEEIKKIDFELGNTPDLYGQYEVLRAELERSEERWLHRTKDIPREDLTQETNAYINNTILSSGRVKVDVQYNTTKQEAGYGYNVYTLKGESRFNSLYRFLWYLENGRRLYKLNKLGLRGVIARETPEDEPHPLIQFDMEMRAYFTPQAELSTGIAWRDTTVADLVTNPYWPLIRADLPPNKEGLVEVERSELKAVIPEKAFVTDQAGKLRTLTLGDRVYLGYVSKISPEEGKVEFVLNRGGISEVFILKVRFRQPETEANK